MACQKDSSVISRNCLSQLGILLLGGFVVSGLAGCGKLLSASVEAQPEQRREQPSLPKVESAIAQTKPLLDPLTYKGNTLPQQIVSLRSQVEGQLQELTVDVGDVVQTGQVLARLHDDLLETNIAEAEAELASRLAEVNRSRNQVTNATIQLEQARTQAKQAQADAERFQNLAQEGAIAQQEAELAQTEAIIAQKQVRAAQEQIKIEQDAVATAQEQVRVQRSIIAQAQERLSYSTLESPITGVVLERMTDPGNLIQLGDELLTLGNFQKVKVRVTVSELALGEIRQGQSVTVNLDAFPNESYTGKITRISPAANPETRQIPVEITLANPQRKIGSGLMARVTFPRQETERVVIPETALQEETENNTATVFVLNATTEPPSVEAQTVQISDRANNQVEILSGLSPQTPDIGRSSRPLTSGEAVNLSALSRTGKEE